MLGPQSPPLQLIHRVEVIGWRLHAWRGKLRRPGAANTFLLPPQCILIEQGCHSRVSRSSHPNMVEWYRASALEERQAIWTKSFTALRKLTLFGTENEELHA